MRGLEHLTSNTAIAYPFSDGQDAPDWVLRLFADASVASGTYDSALTRVEFSAQDGRLSFRVDGRDYSLAISQGTPDFARIDKDGSLFVVDTTVLKGSQTLLFEGRLLFEPSCVFVDAAGVDALLVYNGTDGTGEPDAVVTGDVALLCGHNIVLAEGEDEGSAAIEAQAGAGLGVVPCPEDCEEDEETDGHPLPTDDGHAVIAGDGCYEMTASGDTVQIHGKCKACCQCDMYADVVVRLKEIAEEVKGEKDRIATDQTNVYFDFIDKFSQKVHSLDMDVQVDVTPDSTIAEAAHRGDRSIIGTGLGGMCAFRVTCTVTNLCGVPVLFTVPDEWNDGEYGRSGVSYISGRTYKGGDTTDPSKLVWNGVQAIIAKQAIAPLFTGYTIDPQAAEASENVEGGRLVSSAVRGPVIRWRGYESDKRKYESVGLKSLPGWLSKTKPSDAWGMMSGLALASLNKGENPSQVLGWADVCTNRVLGAAGINYAAGDGGFLMPAGYSFTISNVYTVPASELQNNEAILAIFRGFAYAPVLMYARAYDWAISEVRSSKTSDGVLYTNAWKLPDTAVCQDYMYRRHVWNACMYNYKGNEITDGGVTA